MLRPWVPPPSPSPEPLVCPPGRPFITMYHFLLCLVPLTLRIFLGRACGERAESSLRAASLGPAHRRCSMKKYRVSEGPAGFHLPETVKGAQPQTVASLSHHCTLSLPLVPPRWSLPHPLSV